MTRSAPLTVLAALWIAASASAQMAQTSAPADVPKTLPPGEKAVVVTLLYDEKGAPVGVALPDPDPVELSWSKHEKAHWYLSPKGMGSLKIEMKAKDPKPFKAHPKNNGKDSLSEAPTRGVRGAPYDYSITVHVDSLNKDFVLDPIIKTTP